MREIGLYYPYFHVRNDAWLKAAALYWPALARLAPSGYPIRDSETARVLREELGFLVEVDPLPRAREVAAEFGELVRREGDALRQRFGLPSTLDPDPTPYTVPEAHQSRLIWTLSEALGPEGRHANRSRLVHDRDPALAWIHREQLPEPVWQLLVESGLAVTGQEPRNSPEWIGMHPVLVSVYTAALVDRIAQVNDMYAVTDQTDVHGMLNGWTVDTLAHVLLDDADAGREVPSRDIDEIAVLFAVVAIQTVVPANLADVPVDRIVKARKALAEEFHAFRDHLDSLSEQFEGLRSIEDPRVLQARLKLLVDRSLRAPMADLEKGLRQLGLEPARAVLSMKSLDLPPVAAAAATAAGLPPVVGQAGMVAAQLLSSGLSAHRSAQNQRRGAAGYLLGLRKQLTPRGVVSRVRAVFRRAHRH